MIDAYEKLYQEILSNEEESQNSFLSANVFIPLLRAGHTANLLLTD